MRLGVRARGCASPSLTRSVSLLHDGRGPREEQRASAGRFYATRREQRKGDQTEQRPGGDTATGDGGEGGGGARGGADGAEGSNGDAAAGGGGAPPRIGGGGGRGRSIKSVPDDFMFVMRLVGLLRGLAATLRVRVPIVEVRGPVGG